MLRYIGSPVGLLLKLLKIFFFSKNGLKLEVYQSFSLLSYLVNQSFNVSSRAGAPSKKVSFEFPMHFDLNYIRDPFLLIHFLKRVLNFYSQII